LLLLLLLLDDVDDGMLTSSSGSETPSAALAIVTLVPATAEVGATESGLMGNIETTFQAYMTKNDKVTTTIIRREQREHPRKPFTLTFSETLVSFNSIALKRV
jgi:hypothetical protein